MRRARYSARDGLVEPVTGPLAVAGFFGFFSAAFSSSSSGAASDALPLAAGVFGSAALSSSRAAAAVLGFVSADAAPSLPASACAGLSSASLSRDLFATGGALSALGCFLGRSAPPPSSSPSPSSPGSASHGPVSVEAPQTTTLVPNKSCFHQIAAGPALVEAPCAVRTFVAPSRRNTRFRRRRRRAPLLDARQRLFAPRRYCQRRGPDPGGAILAPARSSRNRKCPAWRRCRRARPRAC